MDIYIPYTYFIGWTKYNKFYYGRRTAKNCNPIEFWNKYFTSSDRVKEFRKKHGDPDIIQIRKTFPNNSTACILWEHKVLRRINAKHNTSFLNQTNGDCKWDTTGISRKLSEKEKSLISQRMLGNTCATGKPKSDEHKQKISESQKGISRYWLIGNKRSKETRDKQSNSLKGKNKGYVTCFDITIKAFVRIPASIYHQNKGTRYFGTGAKIIKNYKT